MPAQSAILIILHYLEFTGDLKNAPHRLSMVNYVSCRYYRYTETIILYYY